MYGYKCEFCNCALDPGEGRICEDCREREEEAREANNKIRYPVKDKDALYVS